VPALRGTLLREEVYGLDGSPGRPVQGLPAGAAEFPWPARVVDADGWIPAPRCDGAGPFRRDRRAAALAVVLRRKRRPAGPGAVALTAEITAQGYRGSVKTVRRYLQPRRNAQTADSRASTTNAADRAGGDRVAHRHPDSLIDDERAARDAVLTAAPRSAPSATRSGRFAAILTQRRGHDLHAWLRRSSWSTPVLTRYIERPVCS